MSYYTSSNKRLLQSGHPIQRQRLQLRQRAGACERVGRQVATLQEDASTTTSTTSTVASKNIMKKWMTCFMIQVKYTKTYQNTVS